MPEDSPTSETDFADLTDYLSIELPVKYGDRSGIIYAYSHKDHLKNSLLKNYKKELGNIIEIKKYCDSALCSWDIGPTITIANLIEDGEYAEFVKSFNHGDVQLTGLEHILKVKEKWKGIESTHYLMPKSDEMIFGLAEQMGVVHFALVQKIINEKKKIKNPNLEKAEYVLQNDKEFGRIFREEILKKTKINNLDGYPRVYENCVIYKDLFYKILEILKFSQEDFETADNIAKVLNLYETA